MKYLITYLLLLLTTAGYSEELVPVVKIQTNLGIIVMELYPDKAPQTVKNFLRYANEGFYEGTIFHRVIENFIVQAGGYQTDYTKKPTYDPIANESKNGLRNLRGSVAMARNFDDPDSATSQFFINVNNNYSLDYQDLREELGYTVFGQVISGMDVVDKIQAAETGSFGALRKNVPQDPIIIAKMTVERAPPQRKSSSSPLNSSILPLDDKASEDSDNQDLTSEESLEPPVEDQDLTSEESLETPAEDQDLTSEESLETPAEDQDLTSEESLETPAEDQDLTSEESLETPAEDQDLTSEESLEPLAEEDLTTEESLEPSAAATADQIGDDHQESEATPVNDDQPEQTQTDNKVEAEVEVPVSKAPSPENKSSKVSPANNLAQPPDAPSKPDKPEPPSS
jgi:cyclophilin family peptidyl-prolyl cis-trans isomerase